MARNLLLFLAGVGTASIGCSVHFLNYLNVQSKKTPLQLELIKKELLVSQLNAALTSPLAHARSRVQTEVVPRSEPVPRVEEDAKVDKVNIKTDPREDKITIEIQSTGAGNFLPHVASEEQEKISNPQTPTQQPNKVQDINEESPDNTEKEPQKTISIQFMEDERRTEANPPNEGS
eukprot:TRINITY_DN10270_c0_g1_i17.p1 TRINITY_DN10270_c0_g1~~TRINITY_DN10270_c0_g1_i17.p1  ORF type:complete len:198 (+),score=26.58 TRINITY_DN10270_c0_g1_i17:69-596(+)